MQTPTVLLKCAAKALVLASGMPFGDFVVDPLVAIVEDIWGSWSTIEPKPEKRRAEVVALSKASTEELAKAVGEVVATIIAEYAPKQ